MNRQISLAQYRTIDLSILTGLMAVSQLVIHVAVKSFYAEQTGYIVSPVAAVVALVMMRWSFWAAIPAVLGGLILSLLSGGTAEQMLIYSAGNLISILACFMLKLVGKERIRQNVVLSLAFAVVLQLMMQLGRAAMAALLGHPLPACLDFITTDAMSILFTLVIIWIVRRVEGLFEDQKHYLLRIQQGQSEKGGEQL
ncbi:MAG: hypothetical protein J6V34_04620 [Oscillospiraceae bacterium]|nr:hypothetical protein [Oscillospiraceae bacterium]